MPGGLHDLQDIFLEEMARVGGVLRFSVYEYLQDNARVAPDKPVFMAPGRAGITYRDLLALATQTVGVLNGRGFGTGSRIAVVLPHAPMSAAICLSVMAGMAIFPISGGATAETYATILQQARADAVLLREDDSCEVRAAAQRLGLPLMEVREPPNAAVGEFEIAGAAAEIAPAFAAPDDLLMILSTSGTTGTARLVTFTHREMVPTVYTVGVEDSSGIFFQMAPFQHLFGVLCLLHAMARQQASVFPPLADTGQLFQYLARYRPQLLLTIPTVLKNMVERAPQYAAEIAQWDLRIAVTGTTRLDEELRLALHQRLGLAVRITYGSTEVGLATSLLFKPGDSTTKSGSVGPATVWSRVRIVDEDGAELPTGAVGEIRIASAQIVHGYENDAPATAAAFHDGWFSSGDLGYLDGDGYLFVSGRIKEMVNRGGSKVVPEMVDKALREHPAVIDAACFSFPHTALGEDLAAAIVSSDPSLTEREMRFFASSRLPMQLVPSRFVFTEEIPRTTLGKARRALLTEEYKVRLGG